MFPRRGITIPPPLPLPANWKRKWTFARIFLRYLDALAAVAIIFFTRERFLAGTKIGLSLGALVKESNTLRK